MWTRLYGRRWGTGYPGPDICDLPGPAGTIAWPNWEGLAGLQHLWLQDNRLTGSVPLEPGQLTSVQILS